MIKTIKIDWVLVTGLVIILSNLYWIWDNLYLLYIYHFTGVLFLFMQPDWVLLLNAALGLLGVVIGISVIRLKTKTKQGILIDFAILLSGALIKMIIAL